MLTPRLKPYLGKEELLAVFRTKQDSVQQFESAFAYKFGAKHALAFSYGRSALWAFFNAMEIKNAEVIQPAYTCSVVAHATVLSGNIPHFVDIDLYDYNMNLEQVGAEINERTRVIIATHLFGYPLNVDSLNEIVRAAEHRFGHKIWVIQDCAHSFGAKWNGKLVCNEGDAALFGLGISKTITSIFGGLLSLNDYATANQIRNWRDAHFRVSDALKSVRRLIYLLTVYPAFNHYLYGLVNWLEEQTPFLDRLTKAYHLDHQICFPPDYLDRMTALEASVGLAQLEKYETVIQRRQENSRFYYENFPDIKGWVKPPVVNGATYSHYVIRVPDRKIVMDEMRHQGVQLGQLIEYSVPHMKPYQKFAEGRNFPNSLYCSQHTINLAVFAGLSHVQRQKILESLHRWKN